MNSYEERQEARRERYLERAKGHVLNPVKVGSGQGR